MNQETFVKGFHNETEVEKMLYKRLGTTGLMVSYISIGGCTMGNIYGINDEASSIETVKLAISSGINYIDTAPWYGQGRSEEVIGKALKDIPRSAYYIGTKVGRYEKDVNKMFDFSPRRIEESVNESLARLNLDYVDIIQVHDVEFCEDPNFIINQTLPTLKKIVDAGKARYIGITGYPLKILKYFCENSIVKISSVLSYCRNTLIDDELNSYLPFFKENNLGIINGSIFAMGLLTIDGPQSWHPAQPEIKERCLQAALYCKEKGYDISILAAKHSLRLDCISTHLISAMNPPMLRQNLSSIQSPTTDDQKQLIEDIIEKFFKNLKQKNWEGIEIQNYRIMKESLSN